jgi:type I restriction enzyme, S subunit
VNLHGWQTKTLGEVCDISIGGTPSRSVPEYWSKDSGNGIPWVSIADMRSPIIYKTQEAITKEGALRSNGRLLDAGTLLLSFKLTIGRLAFAGVQLKTNEAIAALQRSKINERYLYHGLQFWDLTSDIDQAIKGATLNKQKLKKIRITFPEDVRIQAAIAEVLDGLDHECKLLSDTIAKQERVRAGLLQALLTRGIDENGEIRDPTRHVFKHESGKSIPEKWNLLHINEIADFVGSGVTPKGGSDVYLPSGVPLIRSQNVLNGVIDWEDMAFIDDDTHRGMSRTIVQNHDALLNITGASIGRSCSVPQHFPEANVNQHVCIIRVRNGGMYCGEFVSLNLRSNFGKNQIWSLIAGGNREGLNFQQIRSIRIPWPPMAERQEIAKIIENTSALQSQAVFQLEKLRNLKTGLMHDLLSGRVSMEPLLAALTQQT